MATVKQVNATMPALDADSLIYLRYGRFDDGVVATTESGKWHFFSSDGFKDFLAGEVETGTPLHQELTQKGFLRQGYDVEHHAREFRQTKRFVGAGPSTHYISLGTSDVSLETDRAKAIIDHVITSPSENLHLICEDLGSGVKSGILEFIKDYAKEKNQYEGKALRYTLRSSLDGLTEETAAWLVANGFEVETHFDGVESAHDANRERTGAASFAATVAGLKALKDAAHAAGLENHEFSVRVTTCLTPGVSAGELLDALREQGVREFRILADAGSASVEGFVEAYRALLEALSNAEAGSARIRELSAAMILTRIHEGGDVDDAQSRSPKGLGLSELAYDHDGNIFPSVGGRELYGEGDPMFLLGRAGEVNPKDVLTSHTVRALTIASIVDCLPGYQTIWTAPFLGVDPVETYVQTGDLFPRLPTDEASQVRHGMIEEIFRLLLANQDDADGVFQQLASAS